MRTFVAIDLTDEIRGCVVSLVERLRLQVRGVRWVNPAGMHLTLKFIGEVSEEKSAAIARALRAVRIGEAIPLELRELGFFPNERHPRVFWVGVGASPGLPRLADLIENALEPLGIAREQRAFSPHLTLGRFQSEEGLAKLREALANLPEREFGRMEARAFALFQSILSPRGAQYVKLEEFHFANSI